MVERDYLPYKSAREYQDRKMAKWMGFFISEHTTALNKEVGTIDFDTALAPDEKLLLLNQLFVQKIPVIMTLLVQSRNQKEAQTKEVCAIVDRIERGQVALQTETSYDFINFDQILTIRIEEV